MKRYQMRRALALVLFISLAFASGTAGVAHAGPRKFNSCAELHKIYLYGVASSKGAAQGTDMRAPVVNRAVYLANRKLDRDLDGVVCEVPPAPGVATPSPSTTVPTVAVTPTGVPEVDALIKGQAVSGTLTQDQATMLYTTTGAVMKNTGKYCPQWGEDVFRQGFLNNAATVRVLAAYRLGPELLPWFRSQLEQIVTMVCRYSGYAF
jgi:hypothetical protein